MRVRIHARARVHAGEREGVHDLILKPVRVHAGAHVHAAIVTVAEYSQS